VPIATRDSRTPRTRRLRSARTARAWCACIQAWSSCGDRPTVHAHAERVRERHHPSRCTAHGTIELLAAPEVEREPDLKCGVPRARRARIVLAVPKQPLGRAVLGLMPACGHPYADRVRCR
jgi:hypothetical protein